jgi:hypothetical protein
MLQITSALALLGLLLVSCKRDDPYIIARYTGDAFTNSTASLKLNLHGTHEVGIICTEEIWRAFSEHQKSFVLSLGGISINSAELLKAPPGSG